MAGNGRRSSIAGSVALVTGGARELGAATARRLADEGARVFVAGHHKPSVGRAADERISGSGHVCRKNCEWDPGTIPAGHCKRGRTAGERRRPDHNLGIIKCARSRSRRSRCGAFAAMLTFSGPRCGKGCQYQPDVLSVARAAVSIASESSVSLVALARIRAPTIVHIRLNPSSPSVARSCASWATPSLY